VSLHVHPPPHQVDQAPVPDLSHLSHADRGTCNKRVTASSMHAGVWRWSMFFFRVIGFFLYKPQPPSPNDKYKTSDVTVIIPTIDTDEEAMHEAMRSWVLNEPKEILIVTVGQVTQTELTRIAQTSIAAEITRVLRVDGKANKRIQLVLGAPEQLLRCLDSLRSCGTSAPPCHWQSANIAPLRRPSAARAPVQTEQSHLPTCN
jgi:hypothetical protein